MPAPRPWVLGTQAYPAIQVYGAQPGGWTARLDDLLAAHAAAGFTAWEQSVDDEADAARLAAALARSGLQTPSVYAGGRLHGPDWRETVAHITACGRRARALGATVVACNPDPIRWGGPENKTDAELAVQAGALQTLGETLATDGLRLAYHWHDPEFRHGARELWHVLLNTDPRVVGVCFDTHWTYRGCGNSQAAMMDLLHHTLPRIASFHVRQSRDGVWAETFGPGDIDYGLWAQTLHRAGWSGPVHLEQAREAGTPQTMDFLAAQRAGLAYLRQLA